MAKKLTKKQSKSHQLAKARGQQNCRPLLEESLRMLRRGNPDRALKLATEGSELATTAAERDAAQRLLAEAHFRAALEGPPAQRLARLEQALALTPTDPRLLVQRGVALWQGGDLPAARKELDRAAEVEPTRPGLAYLRQLARLALGEVWQTEGLTESEANTLRTLHALLAKEPTLPDAGPTLATQPGLWQALHQLAQGDATAATVSLKEAADHATAPDVKRLLRYYQGIAAMRLGDGATAQAAWQQAQGLASPMPWLVENLALRLRDQATELAAQEKWSAIPLLTRQTPDQVQDRILAETIGLAHFHLGYEEAQAERWARAAHHWRQAEAWAGNRQIAQNLALAEEAGGNWEQAAQAWREMARRRPRSRSHPDYLDDNQVAGIWRHAAECYREVENIPEAITCLKTAIKYAPKDADLRLDLADALMANEQADASLNEVRRILDLAPDHVEALLRLGTLLMDKWNEDSRPIWRRVLELEPTRIEARMGLSEVYLKLIQWPWHILTQGKGREEIVTEALKHLSDYAPFLASLGLLYRNVYHDNARCCEYLLRAAETDPTNARVVSLVLHELLHVGQAADVERLFEMARTLPRLLPDFWFGQVEQALGCEVGEAWRTRFLDEAVALAEQPHVPASKAALLIKAYEVSDNAEDRTLVAHVEQRIRAEVPESGGVEFIEALKALDADNVRAAKQHFNKAKRQARRAKDASALEFIEEMATLTLHGPPGPLSPAMLARLMEMFPDGPPSLEALESLPDDFFNDLYF